MVWKLNHQNQVNCLGCIRNSRCSKQFGAEAFVLVMEQVVASGNAFPFGWYSQEGKILIYTGIVDIFVDVKVRVEFYCRIYIEIKIERIVVTPVRQEALIRFPEIQNPGIGFRLISPAFLHPAAAHRAQGEILDSSCLSLH